LIAKNVVENAEVKYIASAPDGKEVEELTEKKILMNLRKKLSVEDFFKRDRLVTRREEESRPASKETRDFEDSDKEKLKKVFLENKGTDKAIILNENLEVIKAGSARALAVGLKRIDETPFAVTIDGTVTNSVIEACEEAGIKAIAANNFSATSQKIKLLSF
jgi:hypothetical protein